MISVVIPTLNAGKGLAKTLAALVPGAVDGVIREVIVSDGGSSDETMAIADAAGCKVVSGPAGRGVQLAAGAARARADWLLFLHADTALAEGWLGATTDFLAREEGNEMPRAAAFRFALDMPGARARALEHMVALRCLAFALPYGDQGLLIARRHYDEIGGFAPLRIMEDVHLMRRIPRRRLAMLPVRAVTGADRFAREGFTRRSARNLACLSLYYLRVPPRVIARLYG
jgi:rSAM/selenodomain-associated transferase 2